jgi:hypothetical protein
MYFSFAAGKLFEGAAEYVRVWVEERRALLRAVRVGGFAAMVAVGRCRGQWVSN